MPPIWITFALIMGGTLLFAIVVGTVVLCLLDSHDGPRVRHVESTQVAPRQLSIREIADVRAEQAKRAARAQEIGTGVLKTIDELYEMVHHEV